MTDSTHQKPLDLIVTGGTVVSGQGRQDAAIGVRDGRVACIGAPESMPAADETLDVSGKLVLPGVIDPHVHCRAYSNHIDSLADVARSAAHGGVTTMVVFATGEENETMLTTLGRIREEGEAGSVVDFSLHAWIFEDFEYLADIPKAIDSGVTTFKVMMGYKKRGRGRCIPDEYFYAALDIAGRHGGTVLVHAENGPVIDYLENKAFDAGMDGADFQEYSRPPELEAENVARSIHLADLAGCPLYIVHLTSELALEERARAGGRQGHRRGNLPAISDLDRRCHPGDGRPGQGGAPLREEADIAALWGGYRRDGSASSGATTHPTRRRRRMTRPSPSRPSARPASRPCSPSSTARASPGGGLRRSASCSSRARTRRAPWAATRRKARYSSARTPTSS